MFPNGVCRMVPNPALVFAWLLLASIGRWVSLAWVGTGLLHEQVFAQPQAPGLSTLYLAGFFLGPAFAAVTVLVAGRLAGQPSPLVTLAAGACACLLVSFLDLLGSHPPWGLFCLAFGQAMAGIAAWHWECLLAPTPWRFRGRDQGIRLAVPFLAAGTVVLWHWNQPDPVFFERWVLGILPWVALVPLAGVSLAGLPRGPVLPLWPDRWESLGLWQGLVLASAALAAPIFALLVMGPQPLDASLVIAALSGAILGGLVAMIASQPARQIGWLAVAWVLLVIAVIASWLGSIHLTFVITTAGLALGSLAWLGACRPRLPHQGGAWLLYQAGPWLVSLAVLSVLGIARLGELPPWWIALAGFGMASWSAWLTRRAFVEQILATVLLPCYHVRGSGPGLQVLPPAGPLLLVANHTSYMDPFWLGKAIPRRFIPMMTSVFYDLPGVQFLMREVVGAIRVPAALARKTAPELDEAAAILRQGGCVLIFPEGTLRRLEAPSTKLFGRGVAMLVQQVPEAMVIPVWIEGGWGSYFSYAGGQPGENKRYDYKRAISVAFGLPMQFTAEDLADQRILRRRLRSEVHACRGLLGLEVPPDKTGPSVGADAAND